MSCFFVTMYPLINISIYFESSLRIHMKPGRLIASLFFSLLLISYPKTLKAQSDDFLIKDITFNSTKQFVADFVVERMKAYYIHNTDNSWKKIRKKLGINLKKDAKREAFLKSLESDIRTQFKQVDELGKINLYNKYEVFITEIIGRYAKVHGFAPYIGNCGAGNYNVGFLNDKVRFITFDIRTTTSLSRFSGYEYDNNYVQKLKADYNKAHPGIQHSSYKSTTNACSDKGEPQHNEVFTLNKPDYQLSFMLQFGPFVRQNNSYNCTYLGNHLTNLSVFLWNNKLK